MNALAMNRQEREKIANCVEGILVECGLEARVLGGEVGEMGFLFDVRWRRQHDYTSPKFVQRCRQLIAALTAKWPNETLVGVDADEPTKLWLATPPRAGNAQAEEVYWIDITQLFGTEVAHHDR